MVGTFKSNVVVFRRGGRLSSKERWYYKGMPLDIVNSYKYLGLMFTCNFSVNKSVNDLSLRAKRALMEMHKNVRKIGITAPDVFFKMFDYQIQPILLYASEVWGFRRYESIEKIHLSACKI